METEGGKSLSFQQEVSTTNHTKPYCPVTCSGSSDLSEMFYRKEKCIVRSGDTEIQKPAAKIGTGLRQSILADNQSFVNSFPENKISASKFNANSSVTSESLMKINVWSLSNTLCFKYFAH